MSGLIAKEKIPDPDNISLWLDVNGTRHQSGNSHDMIFSVAQLIAHTSTIMRLEEGDLLLTGTPAGVGPVLPGDVITAGLGDGIAKITFNVIARPAPAKL